MYNILILKELDSKLSKNLPLARSAEAAMQGDREFPNYKYHENCQTFLLMEMSCELQAAFHALRFAAWE